MADWLTIALVDPYWVGFATWGGSVLTIVGLGMTYAQARKARRAAEAAKQATVQTVRALNQRQHLAELGEAGQLTIRTKDYAALGNAQATRLALEMLRFRVDSLEASADGESATNREHRELDRIISILERHTDDAIASTGVALDAAVVSRHLNEVRRTLSRRMEKVKRALPENADG